MLRPLLRRDVACQHRLFSTVASARVSDNNVKNDNVVGKRMPRKRVTKEMVADFVDRYRAVNDGKFPSKTVTKKEVGGSFYTIRAILQELEYNAKLHDTTSVHRSSIVRQTAGGSERSEVKDVETEISLCKIAETADITEADSGLEEKVGNCSGSAATAKGASVVEKDATYGRASGVDVLARETIVTNTENPESGSQIPFVNVRDSSCSVRQTVEAKEDQKGIESPNQVASETVPTDETIMATGTFDERTKTELQGLDGGSAAQASNTENIPRETTMKKTQDGQPESSLWGNLKSFASNIMNIWRNN